MTESQMRTGRLRGSGERLVVAVGIAVMCLVYVWMAPAEPSNEMIDHHLYRLTTETMRNGEGYYASMEAAFDVVYGTDRGALIENVRAFRMPATFALFALLPNDIWVWYLFVGIAGVAGIVASFVVTRPVLGILVTAYLLVLGMFSEGGAWVAQFMATELWAVAPLLGAVAMVLRKRWWLAALLALAAMLVRETAGLVLIVGALAAIAGRVPKAPWLTAAGVGGLAYLLHGLAATEYIDAGVGIGVLDEVSSPSVILRIMGFGLPLGLLLGPALWAMAIWQVRVAHERWVVTGAPLLLVFAGILIDREYWGILVVPFTMLWGIERILDLLQRRRGGADAVAA